MIRLLGGMLHPTGEAIHWVTAGVIVIYATAAIYLFKDCMERCTGTTLPRPPGTCPSPDAPKCANGCIWYAVTAGFGHDPAGSTVTTIVDAAGDK